MGVLDVVRHFLSTTAHTAASIVNVPSGNLAATTTQAALDELQLDINAINLATSYTNAAMSGNLTLEGTLWRSVFLNPNGAARNVYLPSTNVRRGDKIRVTNINPSNAYNQQLTIYSSGSDIMLYLGTSETAAMFGYAEFEAQKDAPTLYTDWNITGLRDYWFTNQADAACGFGSSNTPTNYNFTIKRNFCTVSVYGYTDTTTQISSGVWAFSLPAPMSNVMKRSGEATTETLGLIKYNGSNIATLLRQTGNGTIQYYAGVGAPACAAGYAVQLSVIGTEQVHVITYNCKCSVN